MRGPESQEHRPTRRQKRDLANQARFAKERRRTIKLIAGGVIAGTGLAVGYQTGIFESFFGRVEESSGEVNQTKNLLFRWDGELKLNPKERENYFRRTKDLAITFFSRQMGYDPQMFQSRVELTGRKEFFEKFTVFQCQQEDETVPGFVSVLDDKAFINKDDKGFSQESDNLKRFFAVITHELFHLAPPKKHHAEPISVLKISKPVTYEKGLTAYSLPEPGSQCLTIYRTFFEEAVVDDATSRLTLSLGFTVPTGHEELNQRYRQGVLSLYAGNHRELLGYQQRSDAEGFFRSVGEKIGGQEIKDASILGSDYLIRYFQGAR